VTPPTSNRVMQVSGGMNLLVATIPHPASAEDGIVIREGALHHFTTELAMPIVHPRSNRLY